MGEDGEVLSADGLRFLSLEPTMDDGGFSAKTNELKNGGSEVREQARRKKKGKWGYRRGRDTRRGG